LIWIKNTDDHPLESFLETKLFSWRIMIYLK